MDLGTIKYDIIIYIDFKEEVMKEISAGGVVISNNQVLILKKFRGEWVLPKGRMEKGEELEETALREVKEESGMECEINRYIGYVRYNYTNRKGLKVKKTVHYFYMKPVDGNLKPQDKEGFKVAAFIDSNKAIGLLKHYAEKNMVDKALAWHRDGI